MTHITLPRETVQQAIKALELSRGALIEVSPCAWKECHQHQVEAVEYTPPKIDAAITALRTALEAAPAAQKEEPDALGLFHNQAHTDLGPATRLKAAPAVREPLTDEQKL